MLSKWPQDRANSLVPVFVSSTDKVEYSQLGVRLLVRDNHLRILGTHGDGDRTIMTLKVFGREFGVVKEQDGIIDLTPYVDQLLERLRRYDPSRMKEWIKEKSEPLLSGENQD